MSKISGWSQIETGGTDPTLRPQDSSQSVARLIEIVLELKQLVSIFDPESIAQFQELTDVVNSHINNLNVHLTTSLKNGLVNILEAWESGTLGGGGGGAAVYDNRTALLAATGTAGSMAVVQTEPINLYMWAPGINMWAVKDGNVYYSLADLPSDQSFYIPQGTVLILATTGERYIYQPTAE